MAMSPALVGFGIAVGFGFGFGLGFGVGLGLGLGVGVGSRLLEAVEGARARDLRAQLVVLGRVRARG